MMVIDAVKIGRGAADIFDAAMKEEVVVTCGGGKRHYRIQPIKNDDMVGKSPFDGIKGVKVDMTMDEIVLMIKESRGWSKEELDEWNRENGIPEGKYAVSLS